MIDAELSQAVTIGLSRGVSSWPKRSPEAVVVAYGEEQGTLLNFKIDALLIEMNVAPIDWTRTTYLEACDAAGLRIAAAHPELDKNAVEALVWEFSYGWK